MDLPDMGKKCWLIFCCKFQGLVREVIGKDSWYHSRSLLGLFPQTVLVFDKPGLLLGNWDGYDGFKGT
jgi:hypothetical protein